MNFFIYIAISPPGSRPSTGTLVEMEAALDRPDIRVICVRADDAGILKAAPIALDINIYSMMEMEISIIAEYFDILRSCRRTNTAFYCCNRVSKTLSDGTVTDFFAYPWDDEDQILLDVPNDWEAYGLKPKPPFFPRESSPCWHRLVWLKKTQQA